MMESVLDRLTTIVDGAFAWAGTLPERPTNRVVGLGMAGPTLAVLAIARWLTPSPDGFGTHKQLGLGGCAMLTITGWPCPMCGMTTTFSLMAHLRFMDALLNQPFGVVLFSLTVIGAVVGVYDAITAKGLFRSVWRWVERREQKFAMGLLVGMILGWVYKSVLLHPGTFGLGA